MRIVAAPNAFKGSLTSLAAAEAIRSGIIAACPTYQVDCVPVADGGDGLVEVLAEALAAEVISQFVRGPYMEEVQAAFAFMEKKKLGVVEMALASGLTLLPKSLHNPLKTSTYGTGELIKAALDKGCERIMVGLGGSATCDGGIGMATALGYRFLNEAGKYLTPVGASLTKIHSIDTQNVDQRLKNVRIEAVCDVSNPLTGRNGASFVYSPQKGANPEQVKLLDEGLENLADVVQKDMGISIKTIAGAGAAGGLGGGLVAFCGADLCKGIDLVIDVVGLKEKLQGADLVVTGEGQIDFQTKFDKAPAGVAKTAAALGIPCIAVCGSVGERIEELYELGIHSIFSICQGPQSLESAMENAKELLSHTSEQVIRTFQASSKGEQGQI